MTLVETRIKEGKKPSSQQVSREGGLSVGVKGRLQNSNKCAGPGQEELQGPRAWRGAGRAVQEVTQLIT